MSFKNEILLIELEQFFAELKLEVQMKPKEAVFSKIMPTKRKFRADYYLPAQKIILEVNGGQFSDGRHTRGGKGYENDLVKSNLASLNGFFYLQYTYQMLATGTYKNDILLICAKNHIKNIIK